MSGPISHPPTETNQPTATRYLVLVWMCAAAAIAYIQRNGISVAESTIRSELGLSKEEMGWVLGGFFWTYALLQVPSGHLAERWGSRKALTLYSSIWSVATAVTALTGSGLLASLVAPAVLRMDPGLSSAGIGMFAAVFWLYFFRLLAGAGQAGIFPCSAIIISEWYPATRRGLVTGWVAAFQQVGAILAAGLTGVLLARMNWRGMFLLYSIPGFVWAWFFFRWFRNRPQEHPSVNSAELALIYPASHTAPHTPDTQQSAARSHNDWKEEFAANAGIAASNSTPWLLLATSPALWWICGQQFFRGAGYIFYASWFPTYLQEARGVTVTQSGLLTSLPLTTSLVGTLVGGTISDWVLIRTGSRRLARQGIALVGMIGCASLIFAAFFIENPELAVLVISGGSFFAALAGPASYSISIDMGAKNVATVFGMMNMSGNIGAATFPILVPKLLLLPGGWDSVLFVFGSVYLAAAIFWLLVNPNGTIVGQSLLNRNRGP